MATKTNLEMIFVNALGKKTTLRVVDPSATLTAAEVKTAMEAILAQNTFTSNGGELTSVAGARIVSRQVTDFNLG
ncbi:MAG: DUF2922 domain-containing protein [Desulfotomaculum sp.]|nr:DUF2922 domain-containing protein [Desulfotomaculum sp.]